jgi:hypothetical protein
MRKSGLFLSIFLVTTALLWSQSLVDLAKKEKERRAKLKDQKSVMITNQNINEYKKGPAVTTQGSGSSQTQIPPSAVKESEQTARRGGEPVVKTSSQKEDPAQLQMDLEKAQEYVELLTLKMNALWQEFYSMDDMTSRDSIQRQLDTTYKQLQKAQADEEALKKKAAGKK